MQFDWSPNVPSLARQAGVGGGGREGGWPADKQVVLVVRFGGDARSPLVTSYLSRRGRAMRHLAYLNLAATGGIASQGPNLCRGVCLSVMCVYVSYVLRVVCVPCVFFSCISETAVHLTASTDCVLPAFYCIRIRILDVCG